MIKYLAWFLPLIFIFHDMEEIIGMNSFLKKNKNLLEEKYPIIANQYKNFSTEGFALAVYEEFIICCIITALVFFSDIKIFYCLWLGILIALILHFFVHIGQCLILRKYVPAVITSVLCLPLSVFLFKISLNPLGEFDYFWIILGIILVFINLILILRIVKKFSK